MNSKKIRKALKHVSPEDAEQIGKIWGAPHKEDVWKRINEKMNFEEESFMKENTNITQSKNKKWTGYLSIAAAIALFCGAVGGGIAYIKQSGRANLATAEHTSPPSEFSPAESVYSAKEETFPTEPETIPMLAMGLETVTETTTAVIETTAPETAVTTVAETGLKTVRAETTAVPQTEAVIETLPETTAETTFLQTNLSAEIPSEPSTDSDMPEETIVDAPQEMPDAGITDETPEDVFAGTYSEQYAHRGVITITENEDNTYHVHIRWAGSALESAEWDFNGVFNGRQVLYYTDCVKKHIIYNEQKERTEEIEYTSGTGHLQIAEEGTKTGLVWADDMENSAEDAFFIKE